MGATIDYMGFAQGKPCVMIDAYRTIEVWTSEMGSLEPSQTLFGVEIDPYNCRLTHLTITDLARDKVWRFRWNYQSGSIEYPAN